MDVCVCSRRLAMCEFCETHGRPMADCSVDAAAITAWRECAGYLCSALKIARNVAASEDPLRLVYDKAIAGFEKLDADNPWRTLDISESLG